MSLHRFAAKRDASEPAIVEALEAHGFTVQRLSGPDVPDLLLGKGGITRVVEIKTGRRQLSPGQVEWWARWRGNRKIVLWTVDDAIDLARRWRVNNLDSRANAA